MTTPVTVLDFLKQVRVNLIRDGWMKEGLGTPGGPRCIEGHLRTCSADFGAWKLANAARDAISDVIDFPISKVTLAYWNDMPTTTQDDILAALDKAIQAAHAEES